VDDENPRPRVKPDGRAVVERVRLEGTENGSAGTAAAATAALRANVTDFFRLVLMPCSLRWSRPRAGRSLFDCFVDRGNRNEWCRTCFSVVVDAVVRIRGA
jgi:hypothetical protein